MKLWSTVSRTGPEARLLPTHLSNACTVVLFRDIVVHARNIIEHDEFVCEQVALKVRRHGGIFIYGQV
jgi:hypothetical protein